MTSPKRSSAKPHLLKRYTKNMLNHDDTMLNIAQNLALLLDAVSHGCTEPSFRLDPDLAAKMVRYAANMRTHDLWVQQVAHGFILADAPKRLPSLGKFANPTFTRQLIAKQVLISVKAKKTSSGIGKTIGLKNMFPGIHISRNDIRAGVHKFRFSWNHAIRGMLSRMFPPIREQKGGQVITVKDGDTYEEMAKEIYGISTETYVRLLQEASNESKPMPGQTFETKKIWVVKTLTYDDLKRQGVKSDLSIQSEGSFDKSSPYYFLVPHHPSPGSGVTIGAGYDLSLKTQEEVKNAMLDIGLSDEQASRIAGGVGLTGYEADKYKDSLSDIELTADQAKKLFGATYAHEANKVLQKINEACGSEGFPVDHIDHVILELIIDLGYRGDAGEHKGQSISIEFIKKIIKDNDITKLRETIADPNTWTESNLNYDRYRLRCEHLGATPTSQVEYEKIRDRK